MQKKFGAGQSVKRVEDFKLLIGEGKFTDDIRLENECIGLVFRSTVAHAKILNISVDDAREVDGVLAVYTADDIAGHIKTIPCDAPIPGQNGKPCITPDRPVLAKNHVRYVGEPVAFIVAENINAARDAADLIDVDYDLIDAVCLVTEAVKEGAPQLHKEAPGNVAVDWAIGDKDGVDAAFQRADETVSLTVTNNRLVPNPMEPRALVGIYNPDDDDFLLYGPSQGVWGLRDAIVQTMEGYDADKIRVVTYDVGGGFGIKSQVYHEHPLVLFAAKQLGRPVRWTADRGETFFCDAHGRDVVSDVSLALDKDGKILAYRVDSLAGFGAYCALFGPFIPTLAAVQIIGGVYQIPSIHVRVKGLFANTPPMDAYRGAGRPEANYMLERLMDAAADHIGMAPEDFRRLNMIKPEQLPYKNFFGAKFDSGNFPETMEKALKLAEYDQFEERRQKSAKNGKLRGIGMGYYIECTFGVASEEAVVTIHNGRLKLHGGSQSNGQGHATAFGSILADKLGIDLSLIDYVEGDTAEKDKGCGTGGSRSLQMVGNATATTADAMIAKGKQVMSILYKTPEDGVDYEDGIFTIAGTNHSLSLFEVHDRALGMDGLPDGYDNGLDTKAAFKNQISTFPNGCHVAEVEIDPETGVVKLVDYFVVDDFGVLINPMLVKGQIHGGVVQGIGQALTENCVFEEGSGQLLTGSFMDYGMPRADDMPDMKIEFNGYPCQTNPLGIKGCGEAGTIGALPSFSNAVMNALKPLGIQHVEMPYTPLKMWQIIKEAKSKVA